MRFRDALGLVDFDLPLGWRLDLEASTLFQLQFCWWRGEAHKLGVQLMPAATTAEVDDRQWFYTLSRSVEPPELRPSTLQRRQGRGIAIGRRQVGAPGIEHKFVYLRGTAHDIAIHEIESADQPSSPGDRDAVLNELVHGILGTLRLAAEHRPPRAPRQDELMALAAGAYALADVIDQGTSESHAEAAAAACALTEACTDVLLSHLCAGHAPPMMAACTLADGQLIRWQAERAVPALLKAARTIVHRVRCAYAEALEHDTASCANIDALEARIVQAEAELLAPQSPGEIVAADAFQRGRRRARWGMERADAQLAAGRPDIAEACLHDAVDDLLQALVVRKRRARVSAELEASLQAYALQPSQLASLAASAEQQHALGELRHALLKALDLSFRGGDASTEAEVATLLVEVADEHLAVAGRPIELPDDQRIAVVSSELWIARVEGRIRLVRAYIGLGDQPAFERARLKLDEAEQLLLAMEAARGSDLPLSQVPPEAVADLRVQWGAAGELLEKTQRRSGIAPEDLENIGQADAPLPPAGSSPYDFLLAAHRCGAHAAIALNAGHPDDALRRVRQGLACALAASPFNEQVPRLLQLAARAFEQRPSGPHLDDGQLDGAAWYLTLHAAADALDAARWSTRGDSARIGLGDSVFARGLVEQMVEGFAFRAQAPDYAIAAADRFRARVLEQTLQEAECATARDTPPVGVPPDLASDGDDRNGLIAAATHVIEQARVVASARGVPLPLDPPSIAAIAKQRGAALIWIQPVGSRIALLLMGADGHAIGVWSPLAMARWCSAAEGLLGTPDRAELQRRLWDALFEPLQAHLAEGSHVIIVPPADGPLVPYGLLRDAAGRFALDRFVISLAPSLATLRTLGVRGPWLRSRPGRAFILGDPAGGDEGGDGLPAARTEALAVQARLLSAGVPQEAIALRLGGAADLDSYRSEAAHCDLLHLACHAEIVATNPGEAGALLLAGSVQGALHATEVPDVPLADALVVLSACSSGQGRATADGVIGLGRAFLQAGARAVVVSLWPVDDLVAAALFDHFYAALLDQPGGHDAAQALAEATRRTRDDLTEQRIKDDSGPLPPDAAAWAPFVIIGDAQAVSFRSEDPTS